MGQDEMSLCLGPDRECRDVVIEHRTDGEWSKADPVFRLQSLKLAPAREQQPRNLHASKERASEVFTVMASRVGVSARLTQFYQRRRVTPWAG
jgi:hypothetical protein